MVDTLRLGGEARELRQDIVFRVVSHGAAEAEGVPAGFVDIEIVLEYVGAIVQLLRCVEAEDGEVQTAIGAGAGVVAGGVLLEDVKNGLVDADAKRINLADLGWSQLANGAVAHAELDNTLLVAFRRDDAVDADRGRVFAVFPVREKEDSVFDDAPAERGAVLVADLILPGDAGTVGEPVVGRRLDVAVKLIERAMEGVGTGLGDQGDLPTGGAALVRAYPGNGRAELLHGIEGHGEDGTEA